MARPLQFGDSRRPLYGVYHEPARRQGRRRAVVLCNPFGEEAVRAFRIYRLLAEKLADAGAHVLRFDYPGTGDSAGACAEATLCGFAAGALEAQTELLDMCGAAETAFVGLRLGASTALLAARKAASQPAAIVLWDPVTSGRAYLDELRAGHMAAVAAQTGSAPAIADPLREALGFEVSPTMAAELAALDLSATKTRGAKKVVVIAGPATNRSFEDALRAGGADVLWRDDPGETSWNSDQALNAFVVPRRTLDLIAADALA